MMEESALQVEKSMCVRELNRECMCVGASEAKLYGIY